MKKRLNFWSRDAIDFLRSNGRQDIVDKGDALAERVSALTSTALSRLESYSDDGIYCGRGGSELMSSPDALEAMDELVNVRLKAEVDALEKLLSVFDGSDPDRGSVMVDGDGVKLPSWY